MPTYDQNKESAKRYLAKMDEIRIRMSKESGLKDAVQRHIESTGESTNAFILRAIRETMRRDNSPNVTLDGGTPQAIIDYALSTKKAGE